VSKSFFLGHLCLLISSGAFGWSDSGHIIKARIAEFRLTPQARVKIEKLLRPKSHSTQDEKGNDIGQPSIISQAASAMWADRVRPSERFPRLDDPKWENSRNWHFENVEASFGRTSKSNPSENCKNDDCVTRRVQIFAEALRDGTVSLPMGMPGDHFILSRLEMLGFLIHFTGDLHQPLHLCDWNQDRGGNSRLISYLGRTKSEKGNYALNLHGFWDADIIEEHLKESHETALQYANDLNKEISQDEAQEWESGTYRDWANETHQSCMQHAYGFDHSGHSKYINSNLKVISALGKDYYDQAFPAVEKQLKRGGVRLAKLLNAAFN
jgi:nuclease S1